MDHANQTGHAQQNLAVSAALRVLVVEDNEDLRLLVCELLETFGHVVAAAESGEAALECIDGASFDVLLTDVRLPGMSGIDLARKALAMKPDTHVIFASGFDASLTNNVGFPSHALGKPYEIDALQALLVSLPVRTPDAVQP
ncbi:MAG: response regulator [Herminiimonas sp.]|nr:response regulator [Herminiimonas sp.]